MRKHRGELFPTNPTSIIPAVDHALLDAAAFLADFNGQQEIMVPNSSTGSSNLGAFGHSDSAQ